jgi:hypothetical protein
MKSNESDNLRSNLEGGKLTSGEPDAVKVASPVRRREWGNVLKSNALCSYPTTIARINPALSLLHVERKEGYLTKSLLETLFLSPCRVSTCKCGSLTTVKRSLFRGEGREFQKRPFVQDLSKDQQQADPGYKGL